MQALRELLLILRVFELALEFDDFLGRYLMSAFKISTFCFASASWASSCLTLYS